MPVPVESEIGVTRRTSALAGTLVLAVASCGERGASPEITIVGEPAATDTRAMLEKLREGFLPNAVLAVGSPSTEGVPLLEGKSQKNGAATAYVCENGACKLPTTDPAEALRSAATFRPIEPEREKAPPAP